MKINELNRDADKLLWRTQDDRNENNIKIDETGKSHPSVILCNSEDDVVSAVNYARKYNLSILVNENRKLLNHKSLTDKEMVIDLSQMRKINLNQENRTVEVDAGMPLKEIESELQASGLSVLASYTVNREITGCELIQNAGFQKGESGFIFDNILSVRIVTMNGEKLTLSAQENYEQYWKFRGGGEVGIITSYKLQVHLLIPEVLALSVLYDYSDRQKIYDKLEAYKQKSSKEVVFQVQVAQLPFFSIYSEIPDYKRVIIVTGRYTGNPMDPEGEKLIQPLRELAEPISDQTEVVISTELYKKQNFNQPDNQILYM